jgi:hypothetical protein
MKWRFLFAWFLLGATVDETTAADQLKPIRFDHGSPIIFRSGTRFLAVEFHVDPFDRAHTTTEDTFRVVARYRYKTFDAAGTGSIETGESECIEHYRIEDQTINADGKRGRRITNIGSKEAIDAGSLHLGWSNGRSGQRSWIYFGRDPQVEFARQIPDLSFDAVDAKFLRSLTDQTSIHSAGTTTRRVVVYGLVTAGSTTRPLITNLREQDGRLTLHFSGLTPGQRYTVDHSVTLGQGHWTATASFVAQGEQDSWTGTTATNTSPQFFRVRRFESSN